MADLELQRKGLKVKIYDVEYDLKKPSTDQVESFLEKQSGDDYKGKDIKLIKEFLLACGLPLEVSGSMDTDDFNQLATFIVSSGKKKLQANG